MQQSEYTTNELISDSEIEAVWKARNYSDLSIQDKRKYIFNKLMLCACDRVCSEVEMLYDLHLVNPESGIKAELKGIGKLYLYAAYCEMFNQ